MLLLACKECIILMEWISKGLCHKYDYQVLIVQTESWEYYCNCNVLGSSPGLFLHQTVVQNASWGRIITKLETALKMSLIFELVSRRDNYVKWMSHYLLLPWEISLFCQSILPTKHRKRNGKREQENKSWEQIMRWRINWTEDHPRWRF